MPTTKKVLDIWFMFCYIKNIRMGNKRKFFGNDNLFLRGLFVVDWFLILKKT